MCVFVADESIFCKRGGQEMLCGDSRYGVAGESGNKCPVATKAGSRADKAGGTRWGLIVDASTFAFPDRRTSYRPAHDSLPDVRIEVAACLASSTSCILGQERRSRQGERHPPVDNCC